MHGKLSLPSPALVIATIALFVALGGTAVAAGVVPLAKRALSADTLKGKSAAQLMALPGPASTAAGLLSTKKATESLGPDQGREIVIACDGGKKIVSAGYSSPGAVLRWDSRPASDTAWAMYLLNVSQSEAATVELYAVCLG
jgi:hypothetical protein